VNDNSEFLGVGVVGIFVGVLGGWWIYGFVQRRRQSVSRVI
jgi:hypothetical protein